MRQDEGLLIRRFAHIDPEECSGDIGEAVEIGHPLNHLDPFVREIVE
jgi:hypothetical protein